MRKWFPFLLALGCGVAVRGGLAPPHVLVVVNDGDPDSVEIGRYYAETRGIPEANLVHVTLPAGVAILKSAFTNQLWNPVTQYLADSGLEPQIRQVVFAWGEPFQIASFGQERNSLTSHMFYGYKEAPAPPPCELNPAGQNPLFGSGRRFRPEEHAQRVYPSFLLTAGTLAQTRAMIDRAAQADFSHPSGTLHLLRTYDTARNVQWPQFERADFLGRFTGSATTWRLADAVDLSNQSGVAGCMAGLQSHLPQLFTNTFLPGALGDHLTSYGGYLPGASPQMSILDWLRAGCAASYGTVTEPCNYTNKFPTAELHFWYQRGFPAGEAYAMAVSHPYQGTTAGDPLCAPYATPPVVTLTGLPVSPLTGTLSFSAQATSPVAGRRVDRLELYLDGRLHSVLADHSPEPGNEITATLGGTNFTYTVLAGEDLPSVSAGLAAVLDTHPELVAEAGPDHVLVRLAHPGTPVAGLACAVGVTQGAGSLLGLSAHAPSPAFLSPRYRARRMVWVEGTAVAGSSTLAAEVTRLDGVTVSTSVTATAGEGRAALMQRLFNAINADPAFNQTNGVQGVYLVDYPTVSATVGHLVSVDQTHRAPLIAFAWTASGGGLTNAVTQGFLDENADVTTGRAMLFLSAGRTNATASVEIDTTLLPDGPHTARVMAYEGTAVATPGSTSVAFTVNNHDLGSALTWPRPEAWVLQGSMVTAQVAVAGNQPITQTSLWVEGKPHPSGFVWNSSTFGPGRVSIQARVRDAIDREAWSEVVWVRVLADDDRDGMGDEWELARFGNLTAAAGDDPDLDGRTNREEFIADTNPSSSASLFQLTIERPAPPAHARLLFPASLDRRYQIETLDALPWSPLSSWLPVFPEDFPGPGGLFEWTDDGTQVPGDPATRLYRARARLP